MLTYAEALAALDALPIESRTETLGAHLALGRVLAEPVAMDRDQPSFDRATMDGFAIVLDGARDVFDIVSTVLAGQAHAGELAPRQAVRIMTGAPCPAGTTVVPVEKTEADGDRVRVTDTSALVPAKNIARRGEDARAGDQVLVAGTRLSPATVATAAMAGSAEIQVYSPPSLGIVTTGDEVGAAGPAGIHDSNGPLLQAFAAALGCPAERHHAVDDADALRGTLGRAAAKANVVITVGGVSMGTHDLVPGAALDLGFEPVFHKVAIQPGKPVFVARHPDGTIFLGLPGNPVSVLATAHLFGLPLIGRFLGGWRPTWLSLPLTCDHEHRGKRHLFLPGVLGDGGVTPIPWNGSGDLLAAGAGDGLIDLAAGRRSAAGDLVRFLPFLGHSIGDRGRIPMRGTSGEHC